MKNNLKFVVTAIFLFNMVFLLNGCSQSPTGLGEALIKITPPFDGSWTGLTSQQKNIHFGVLEEGNRVSGLSITIYISEDWGYGEVIYQPPNVCNVANNEFEISYDFFGITGKFTNAIDCSGTFFCDDYFFVGDVVYTFSAAGSWNAGLSTATVSKNISQNIEPDSFVETVSQRGNGKVKIQGWIKNPVIKLIDKY